MVRSGGSVVGAYVLGALFFRGAIAGAFGLFNGDGSNAGPDPDPDAETIEGGLGDDDLTGSGNSVVLGEGGNDHLTLTGEDIGQGDAGNDTLTGDGNSVLYGGADLDWLVAQDHATDYGGASEDHGQAWDDATVYGDGGTDTLSARGTRHAFGGDGDDTIVLGHEGDNGSVDLARSGETFGGAGSGVFMIDPNGFDDGAYIEINDDTAQDAFVVLVDPSEVASAQWSAVVVDRYHGIYRYDYEIELTDGRSLTLALPAGPEFDLENPPDYPVTFDAHAADGIAA